VFNRVYTTGEPVKTFDWELVRKDESRRLAEISASLTRDASDKRIGFRGIVRDVTDRRHAENALRESEERYRNLYDESRRAEEVYRSLLHTSADAIVIYDMEGKTRYLNPAFSKIFGWTLEELEGKAIPFLPDSEKRATMDGIRQILREGRAIQGFETKRYTKDGRILDVSVSGSRYDDHEGNRAGMLAIIRDTSDSKRLEAQFHAAQRMEALGTLAGGIAHDFNNLLMGILGNVSLLQLDTELSLPNRERMKNIERFVQSGAELTRQLLGLTKGGKYETKPTNINDIVKKSAEMFGRTKKEITVHHKYEENIWTVDVDQGQVEQVLLNLYVNAWQAMPAGGELYLETENAVLDEIFTRPFSIEPGRYVKISVTDTGVGMDKMTQERIFDPFFTTKEMGRGTGLGLASVYGIISSHGGIILVYSEKGRGATFTIFLPASEKEAKSVKELDEKILKGSETILLVDDEKMIIDVGKQMMQTLGYRVLVASTGKEAVSLYEKNIKKIDIVILDMIMPHMSGARIYERLREINDEVKVLLSSGYSMNEQAKEILAQGCQGFMQKPFNLKDLSMKLREILDKN
jgi:PAS domain S-box-containing protein